MATAHLGRRFRIGLAVAGMCGVVPIVLGTVELAAGAGAWRIPILVVTLMVGVAIEGLLIAFALSRPRKGSAPPLPEIPSA
jgi:hypothetical protein